MKKVKEVNILEEFKSLNEEQKLIVLHKMTELLKELKSKSDVKLPENWGKVK